LFDANSSSRNIAAVKPAEVSGEQYAEQKKTQSYSYRIGSRVHHKISDAADQDVGDGKVENAPNTLMVDEESPCPGGLAKGI
jgi:hypothetical protein